MYINEMQTPSAPEKVTMIGGTNTPVVKVAPAAQDPVIQRTRKIFIILSGILLGLCVIGVILGTISFASTSSQAPAGATVSRFFPTIVAIFVYSFGIFAAVRYWSLGLRIFAWLGIVYLVIVGLLLLIMIGLIIFGSVGLASLMGTATHDASAGAATFSVVLIAGFFVLVPIFIIYICEIFLVHMSFKLARLINAKNHSNLQQI